MPTRWSCWATSSSCAICPLAAAVEIARPFFDELGAAIGDGRVVVVPGNHDHHLLDDWLERRRLDGAAPLGLEQRIPIDAGPLAELTAGMGKTEVELAYPGVWLRPSVYATHGHYLDRHLTVPTFERLAVAAVERVLSGSRDPSDDDLACPRGPGIGVTGRLRAHPGAAIRVPVRPRPERRLAEGAAGRGKPVGPGLAGGRRRVRAGGSHTRLAAWHRRGTRARWGSRIGSGSGR